MGTDQFVILMGVNLLWYYIGYLSASVEECKWIGEWHAMAVIIPLLTYTQVAVFDPIIEMSPTHEIYVLLVWTLISGVLLGLIAGFRLTLPQFRVDHLGKKVDL